MSMDGEVGKDPTRLKVIAPVFLHHICTALSFHSLEPVGFGVGLLFSSEIIRLKGRIPSIIFFIEIIIPEVAYSILNFRRSRTLFISLSKK